MSTSTIDEHAAPPVHTHRSWGKAFDDLRRGWQQKELWGHLGWQDIKQRYRRSVLGPIWITLSMAVTATGLGLLYSQLFETELHNFLPYVTVGFIVWNFVSGCVSEGAEVFIANEGLIKFLPSPLSVHVYRLIWRQVLFFLHNLIVWVVMLAVFPPDGEVAHWKFTMLMAIPAFVILALNGLWVAFLTGVISTRFRDIPPIIGSVMQLLFFGTPIVWELDKISQRTGITGGVLEFNPFLHFVEMVRQPMLGRDIIWHHWVVAGIITVVGWALALLFMRNYRARVSYWV
ncbi:galactan export ABC transporter permease subunit Wzm/RfbD [Allokutzneria oryzae]|uniref:ABC transporter permease n=1 Tax=Allokutzneria oryzae TaxID=1378989 RepID=A0ABV5ZZR3_9PSEU